MKIRPAKVNDSKVLASVHVDSWRAVYRELVPESTLENFNYKGRERSFNESLATGAEETYLTESDQEIVGFLTFGAARDPDLDPSQTGEIWGIYLSPDYWRQGIGSWTVEKAESMLASRGCGKVVLWVLEDNHQARRFYEAMGYKLDGERKEIDWGRVLKTIRTKKKLSPEHTSPSWS